MPRDQFLVFAATHQHGAPLCQKIQPGHTMIEIPKIAAELDRIDLASTTIRALLRPTIPIEPDPPAPAPNIQLSAVTVNRTAIVCGAHWHGRRNGPTYYRYPDPEVLTPTKRRTEISTANFASWDWRDFGSTNYTLLIDGISHATINVTAGVRYPGVDVDVLALSPGWHLCKLANLAVGESCIPWYILVMHGATLPPEALTHGPIVMANHHFLRSAKSVFFHGMIPASVVPTPRPLAARTYPSIPDLTAQSQLQRTQIVPISDDLDIYRPQRDHRIGGAMHCYNPQRYAISQLTAVDHTHDALDGPRGVGTCAMATHISIGAATAPELGGLVGHLYVVEPRRVIRISSRGVVKTLLGHRMDVAGGAPVLIGDWSAVPADKRRLREAWGMTWDRRTLVTDESATPITVAPGISIKPHLHDPVMLVADSLNNRVLSARFNKSSHDIPAVITELIAITGEIFDVVADDVDPAIIYISERAAHRVTAWNIDTKQILHVVVAGARLSQVTAWRTVTRLAPLETLRAEPIVGPEGLYVQDRWLYIGSWAQQQIIRIHLDNGAREVVQTVSGDSNSHFVKLALSDGTMGPRGKVYYCTWSSINAGHPMGVPRNYNNGNEGPGLPWHTYGYASAVGVSHGRILCSSSSEGLIELRAADTGQRGYTRAEETAMLDEWESRGYSLLHGRYGYGHMGLPLPWGESAAIDNYLRACGHDEIQD
jgi:hypothetical protein